MRQEAAEEGKQAQLKIAQLEETLVAAHQALTEQKQVRVIAVTCGLFRG
jgi:hypothetical protein